MSIRVKPVENLSKVSHDQILDNAKADMVSKLVTITNYMEIGYTREKALQIVGLKESDIKSNG